MLDCLYKSNEVPYGTLEQFGLTQEMIEDLPEEIYNAIRRGHASPVLPIVVKGDDGTIVKARTRFRLKFDSFEDVDVVFYPCLKRCDLDRYSEAERKILRQGRAILSHAPDDENLKCFVQIDPETNQILYVPAPVIGRNISYAVDALNLSLDQIQLLQEGCPVAYIDDDVEYVVAIDLTEKTGVRIQEGLDYREVAEHLPEMDRYNFGLYGCWVKDEDGNLDYVHEEDYPDEIWQAMQNAVDRTAGVKR